MAADLTTGISSSSLMIGLGDSIMTMTESHDLECVPDSTIACANSTLDSAYGDSEVAKKSELLECYRIVFTSQRQVLRGTTTLHHAVNTAIDAIGPEFLMKRKADQSKSECFESGKRDFLIGFLAKASRDAIYGSKSCTTHEEQAIASHIGSIVKRRLKTLNKNKKTKIMELTGGSALAAASDLAVPASVVELDDSEPEVRAS